MYTVIIHSYTMHIYYVVPSTQLHRHIYTLDFLISDNPMSYLVHALSAEPLDTSPYLDTYYLLAISSDKRFVTEKGKKRSITKADFVSSLIRAQMLDHIEIHEQELQSRSD